MDMKWEDISKAPKDGSAFLAFGIHDTRNDKYWEEGDHWWAIILWDVFRSDREPSWVFSKDGAAVWSEPLMYSKLTVPDAYS